MATVWLVTVGDQERNFRRKRDAVLWLVRLTHDVRQPPPVYRSTPCRYHYYGPGDDLAFVTRAVIDRLGFPPRRFYRPRKGRTPRRGEPGSTPAVREDVAPPIVPLREQGL